MIFRIIFLLIAFAIIYRYLLCKDAKEDNCLFNSVEDIRKISTCCTSIYFIYMFVKSIASFLFYLLNRASDIIINIPSQIDGSLRNNPEFNLDNRYRRVRPYNINDEQPRNDTRSFRINNSLVNNSPSENDNLLENVNPSENVDSLENVNSSENVNSLVNNGPSENNYPAGPVPHASKLIAAVAYIEYWLERKQLLRVKTPYNFRNTTLAYNRDTAKKYLIELISIDRSNRLARMLGHICFAVSTSVTLVNSLAVLITWSFGIPEESNSIDFKQVKELFESALFTPRDSFVLDFVLFTLLGNDIDNTDLINEMSHEEFLPFIHNGEFTGHSAVIDRFLNSPFMKKEIKICKSGLIINSLKKVKSVVVHAVMGYDVKFIKREAFYDLTNSIMKELNMAHLQIRVLDGKSDAPSRDAIEIHVPPVFVNESPLNIRSDYTKLIESSEGVSTVFSFKNDVVPRRNNLDTIKRKVELLMCESNLKLFNRKRKHFSAYFRLKRLQRSFGNIITNLRDYEMYIEEYEKRFVLVCLFKVCELLKEEFFTIKERELVEEVNLLKDLKNRAVTAVWCLDLLHKKFLKFDKSYGKDEFHNPIKRLYGALLREYDLVVADT